MGGSPPSPLGVACQRLHQLFDCFVLDHVSFSASSGYVMPIKCHRYMLLSHTFSGKAGAARLLNCPLST